MNVAMYAAAKTKLEKGAIVMKIVQWIRDSCRDGGGFVRQDSETGQWFEIGDNLAREKVGHAIRDAVKARQRSERKVSGVAVVPAPAKIAALTHCPKATGTCTAIPRRRSVPTPPKTQHNSANLSPSEPSGEIIDGFRRFHSI